MKRARVAIPTYDNVAGFRNKTYTLLTESPRLLQKTTLFVQTPSDYAVYNQEFPDLRIVKVTVNGKWERGLTQATAFIRNYYPLDTPILFLHDDVRHIVKTHADKPPSKTTLGSFLRDALRVCAGKRGSMVGLYPVLYHNRSLACAISKGLVFIYDPVHLEINVRLPSCTFEWKCDYQYTLDAFKQGSAIYRLNHYAATARHKPCESGKTCERNKIALNSTKRIVKDYPGLVLGYSAKNHHGDTRILFNKNFQECILPRRKAEAR